MSYFIGKGTSPKAVRRIWNYPPQWLPNRLLGYVQLSIQSIIQPLILETYGACKCVSVSIWEWVCCYQIVLLFLYWIILLCVSNGNGRAVWSLGKIKWAMAMTMIPNVVSIALYESHLLLSAKKVLNRNM